MGIGYRRPLCCFCWLFVLTVAAAMWHRTRQMMIAIVVGSLLIALIFFIAAWRKPCHRARFLYVAFLSLAVLTAGGRLLLDDAILWHPVTVYADQTQIIRGTVLEREYTSANETALTVRVTRIGEESVYIGAYLICGHISPLQVGDQFEAKVLLADIRTAEEDPSTVHSHLSRGCRFFITADKLSDFSAFSAKEREDDIMLRIRIAAARIRERWSLRLSEAIGGEEGDLCSALLLGDKQGLDGTTVLDFRRSGVSHLLALSGMHLSILMGFAAWMLRKGGVPFGVRTAVIVLLAIGYLILTGCAVSTFRATVMLLYLQVSHRYGRPSDSLTSLSVFFAAWIAFEPYMLYDAALWLSSLAAFVLVGIVPVLKERGQEKKGRSPVVRLLWDKIGIPVVSSVLIVTVLVVPMWVFFGEVSLLSPLTTLLLSPAVMLLLCLGALWLPLSMLGAWTVSTFWCEWIAEVMRLLSSAVLRTTADFSDFQDTVLSLRYDFCDWLIPLFGILLAVFLLIRLKRPRTVLLLPAVAAIVFTVLIFAEQAATSGVLQTAYLAKGKSEVLLLAADESTVICDMTDGSYSAYRPILYEGITKAHTELDAVVLTHYHGRHVSTMGRVFERIKVRRLYLPLTMSLCDEEKAIQDEGIARKLLALARAHRVEVVFFEPWQELSPADGIYLEMLSYEIIERSAHPTLCAIWRYDCPNGADTIRLTHAGSAFSEAERMVGYTLAGIAQSNTVILGAHGPLIKQPIEIEAWSPDFGALIIPTEEVRLALVPNEATLGAVKHAQIYLGREKIFRLFHRSE